MEDQMSGGIACQDCRARILSVMAAQDSRHLPIRDTPYKIGRTVLVTHGRGAALITVNRYYEQSEREIGQ